MNTICLYTNRLAILCVQLMNSGVFRPLNFPCMNHRRGDFFQNYIQQVNDETVCSHNLGIYVVRMQDSTPANTQIGLLNCSDLNGNVTYQASGSQNALGLF